MLVAIGGSGYDLKQKMAAITVLNRHFSVQIYRKS
jgi:hypothetical protein